MAANWDNTRNNENVQEKKKKFHDRKNDENGYDKNGIDKYGYNKQGVKDNNINNNKTNAEENNYRIKEKIKNVINKLKDKLTGKLFKD